MKKQRVSENIVHYMFDPEPDMFFATSVTVVFSGNQAILIDTAYEFQVSELINELATNHIKVNQIILTHFHDDHMRGLKLLPKVPVYGNSRFQETLDMWTEKEFHYCFTPSIPVNEPKTLLFGEHKIILIPFPGHSLCSMLINIDNKFLHISDELMFSPDGVPLLPSSDGNDIKRHLDSLDRLVSV